MAVAHPALRVLLVEDTDADRLVVQLALSTLPGTAVQLAVATSLAEVPAVIASLRPELVLCDLTLPDSDGLATYQCVQALVGDVPVVVQSALDEHRMGLAAVQAGAQDYLLKGTFDDERLHAAVRYALQRHRAEQALRRSEARYALALAGAHDGIWDWDMRQEQVWVSSRWLELLGRKEPARAITPEEWFARVHPDDEMALGDAIANHAGGITAHLSVECRLLQEDGRFGWVHIRGLATKGPDGLPQRMAGSMSDITERKTYEHRLLHEALHDALTGLANRALCLDRISHAMERRRRRPESLLAVVFLDLDSFKKVNDTFGHAAGDALLVAFAKRLRPLVRPTDTVARLAGDEFCLVLEEMADASDAQRVKDRVTVALKEPFEVDGHTVYVTASMGIAWYDGTQENAQDLLRHADLAMYRNKPHGQPRFRTSDFRVHVRAVARLELETELREAVEARSLSVHFQPIVDLQTTRTVAVEALARWRAGSRGDVSPVDFIPLAEEMGLMVPLGRQVLEDAMLSAASYNRRRPWQPILVSVNVSPLQFADPDWLQSIERALDRSCLDPTKLALEITEGVFLKDWRDAASKLDQVRNWGAKVYLDDFGTGYSSLSLLRRLPVDAIKIDRSFVAALHEHEADRAIVRALSELARGLGVNMIAEGIETQRQLDWLLDLGVQYGQGWLFSKPLSRLDDVADAWPQLLASA
jgi:diguanylate cyclase (GGDEF)-like protein/PAS domain S-box-containing protein